MPRTAAQLVAEYQAIYSRADEENRNLTKAESDRVVELVDAAGRQKAVEDKIHKFALDLGPAAGSGFADRNFNRGGGPGDVFVSSQEYKMVSRADMRPTKWSSGVVEVPLPAGMEAKGTLLETTAPAGGAALVQPDVRPGVVEQLFQPLTVADLLEQQQTTSKTVRYLVEGTAVSAAAPVAEAGVKPESNLGLGEVDEAVQKIATVMGISDELLDDSAQVRGYLNSRLGFFVRQTEEDQLLRGGGTPPALRGILNRPGIQTHNRGTFTNLDGIRQMITKSRASYVEPSFILMHPNQAESIDLAKESGSGAYFGDPFRAGPTTLWGKPVVVTNAIGAGTVLVGSRQAATIFRRGGLSLEISNSHQDWFVKNLNMVRAETRLALAVYRPAAFVMGTAFA
jgi:HK97 family phage major capsid protein